MPVTKSAETLCWNAITQHWAAALQTVASPDVQELSDYLETCIEKNNYPGDLIRTTLEEYVGFKMSKSVSRIAPHTLVSVAVMTEEECKTEDWMPAFTGQINGKFVARHIPYSEVMDMFGKWQGKGYAMLCVYKSGTTQVLETLTLD